MTRCSTAYRMAPRDLRKRPLEERRELLESVLAKLSAAAGDAASRVRARAAHPQVRDGRSVARPARHRAHEGQAAERHDPLHDIAAGEPEALLERIVSASTSEAGSWYSKLTAASAPDARVRDGRRAAAEELVFIGLQRQLEHRPALPDEGRLPGGVLPDAQPAGADVERAGVAHVVTLNGGTLSAAGPAARANLRTAVWALRKAVGDDVEIFVDANNGYYAKQAIRLPTALVTTPESLFLMLTSQVRDSEDR